MTQEEKDRKSREPEEPAKPPAQPGPKSDSSRIDLAEAEAPTVAPAAGDTLSIKELLGEKAQPRKAEPARPPTVVVKAIPAEGPKSSTSRISLETAKTETSAVAGAAKDATVRVDLTSVYEREGIAMPRTGSGASHPSSAPATARETSHIQLDRSGAQSAEDTGHITLPGGQAEDTSHIVLPGGSAEETSHIVLPGAPAAPPPPPKTIRLTRPAALPKTVVLPKPETPTAAPPKTVTLKPPEKEAGESKGATSRIAVPEGVVQSGPTTQRKTIRIKRPEVGTSGGKTLVIARPSQPAPITLPASVEQQAEEIARELKAEEDPGVVFGIAALAALLVAAVLLYVLMAQTIAPHLPFPGRVL